MEQWKAGDKPENLSNHELRHRVLGDPSLQTEMARRGLHSIPYTEVETQPVDVAKPELFERLLRAENRNIIPSEN